MSLRHLFKTKFSVGKILPLCVAKAKHHREREAHYREEFAKAEKDLKENGIVMAEYAASVASGAMTGYGFSGRALRPEVDPQKVEAVDKAKNKIQEHKQKAEEYERYSKVFRLALYVDEACLMKLDSEDVLFFGVEI